VSRDGTLRTGAFQRMEIDMKSAWFPVVLLGIALVLPVQAQMSAPHGRSADCEGDEQRGL